MAEGIYRIKIPFEEIYTSVFVLQGKEGCLVVDGGADDGDAENYVLPCLEGAGMRPSLVLRSHCHGDHAGGVERIAREYGAKIRLMEDDFPLDGRFMRLYDGDILLGRFQALNLKGHTDECLAVYDLQTQTLISCDCLQSGGVGRYGVSFTDVDAYLRSVERVKRLPLRRVIASHDFAPYGFAVEGEERIRAYLGGCASVAMNQ